MRGLTIYEAERCDECGFHPRVLESLDLTLGTKVCPMCAVRARYLRVLAEADSEKRNEKWGKTPPADRADPADGRKVVPELAS